MPRGGLGRKSGPIPSLSIHPSQSEESEGIRKLSNGKKIGRSHELVLCKHHARLCVGRPETESLSLGGVRSSLSWVSSF